MTTARGRQADGADPAHERTTLQILDRSMDILAALAGAPGGRSVTDVAAETGLPFPTVSRLLAALRTKGYLRRDEESKLYQLGPNARRLASFAGGPLDIAAMAAPALRRLVAATGESAALWGLDESWRATRCLGCAPSGEPLQVAFAVGAMLPLHAGAAQMALFGELDEFDREVVLAGPLARVTGHTIVDRERVRAELQRLKRRRWAMSVHQEAVGVWSLARMTTEPGATTPMALAVHGPAVRLRREGNQNRLVALTRAVDELTQRLSGLVAGWL